MQILRHTLSRLVTRLAFSPDGRTLFADAAQGFDIWDLRSGGKTFVAAFASGQSRWLHEVDPRGRFLYFTAQSLGGWIYVVADGSWRQLAYDSPLNWLTSIAASPDGRRLAVCRGGGDPVLECLKFGPGGNLRSVWRVVPENHWQPISSVRYFPDGRRVVSVEPQLATPHRGGAYAVRGPRRRDGGRTVSFRVGRAPLRLRRLRSSGQETSAVADARGG
jgi:hypothetical protein